MPATLALMVSVGDHGLRTIELEDAATSRQN
jgi:hypothetical protein